MKKSFHSTWRLLTYSYKTSLVQMVRQRVYQIAAGYEDCNDADFLRIDPALRLALGKDHQVGASQSMLSRLDGQPRSSEE